MTYGHLQADCLYTGISSGPNAQYRVWEAFTFYLYPGRSQVRRPVADLLARVSSLLVIGRIPARFRSATSFGRVCDQDSVMEFGFYRQL